MGSAVMLPADWAYFALAYIVGMALKTSGLEEDKPLGRSLPLPPVGHKETLQVILKKKHKEKDTKAHWSLRGTSNASMEAISFIVSLILGYSKDLRVGFLENGKWSFRSRMERDYSNAITERKKEKSPKCHTEDAQ